MILACGNVSKLVAAIAYAGAGLFDIATRVPARDFVDAAVSLLRLEKNDDLTAITEAVEAQTGYPKNAAIPAIVADIVASGRPSPSVTSLAHLLAPKSRRSRAPPAREGRFEEGLAAGREALALLQSTSAPSADETGFATSIINNIVCVTDLGRYEEAARTGEEGRKLLDGIPPRARDEQHEVHRGPIVAMPRPRAICVSDRQVVDGAWLERCLTDEVGGGHVPRPTIR